MSAIASVEFDTHRWYVEVTVTRVDGTVETSVFAAGLDGIETYDSVEEWEESL